VQDAIILMKNSRIDKKYFVLQEPESEKKFKTAPAPKGPKSPAPTGPGSTTLVTEILRS